MQLSHPFSLSMATIPQLDHAGFNFYNAGANPAVLFGALIGLFLFLVLLFLIQGVVLKLITRMVTGFFPTYGSALLAIFLSGVWLLLVAFITIVVRGRESVAASPGPFQIFVGVVSFLLSAATYGAVLAHPREGQIGTGQGLVVKVVETVAYVSFFFLIGFVLGFSQLATSRFSAPFRTAMGQQYKSADEAQREAVRRYPELGVPGTPFNREFVARYHRYQQTDPTMFNNPEWPLRIADETSRSVNGR